MLKALTDNIWTAEQDQRFMGAAMGTRMTVIRLRDGTLLIHSPIRLTVDLRRQLESLGSPRHVLAPNCYHHLYAGDYPSAFSDVKLYGAPGLPEKRPDLSFSDIVDTGRIYPWSSDIDHIVCEGMPKLNEVALLHRESGTLILTDLAFHLNADSAFSARVLARLTGIYGRLGFSWLDKLLFVRNPDLMRESLQRILSWDFDRVVVAHGSIVPTQGKEAFRRALGV